MFYYKTSFSKKAVFFQRTAKNPFREDMTVFSKEGVWRQKLIYWGSEHFSCNRFFEKNNIFRNNSANFFFFGGGKDHFWGNGAPGDTSKYNLLGLGKGDQIQFSNFFLRNPILSDWNPKNWFCGHTFTYICSSTWPIVSKNNKVHPWVDPHQPCEFHENRFKTVNYVLRVLIHMYIYKNIHIADS